MKTFISQLTGPALEWAVSKALGRTDVRVDDDGELVGDDSFDYTTDWALAGPIIEAQGVCLVSEARDHTVWSARYGYARQVLHIAPTRLVFTYCNQRGPTPLIAAMRSVVASKFGDAVILPEELRE